MTASQSKALIQAARNVLNILPADTDAALAQLQAAIEAVEAKPVAKAYKYKKDGNHPWLKPIVLAEEQTMLEWLNAKMAAIKAEPRKQNIAEPFNRSAIIEKLKYCACGHTAEYHEKDSLENMLQCRAMRCACSYFHYSQSEAA